MTLLRKLYDAIFAVRLDDALSLIKAGHPVNGVVWGESLIGLAARCGHKDIVVALLDAGADANAKDTPIVVAAGNDKSSIVAILLDRGVDIDQRNAYGDTPLLSAVRSGRVDTCRLLLARGANVNDAGGDGFASPLHVALYLNHSNAEFEIVSLLVHHGANLECTMGTKTLTPLCRAAMYCESDIVRLLVENGANVHCVTGDERTLLHCFALADSECELISYLIGKGVRLDCKNKADQTAVHVAARVGATRVVATLVNAGASIYIYNGDLRLPIDITSHLDTVWVLLHAQIRDIVMALAPLALPAYHLLWIIDWLPRATLVTEYRKISHITRVVESINRVRTRKP